MSSNLKCAALLPLALLSVFACGPDETAPEGEDAQANADGSTLPTEDASQPPGDSAVTSRDAGSVARDAGSVERDAGFVPADAGAPTACPCGLDFVCDLSTNTCQPGCFDHQDCSSGKFCDPAEGICKTGCRTVADCADDGNVCTDISCTAGACVVRNNTASCADDGNVCTRDACRNGSCEHAPTNNNMVCGTRGECVAERCEAGQCVLRNDSAGEPCETDENSCTGDVCDGSGTCTHEALPDESPCDDIWPGGWDARCFGGTCAPLRYRCSNYSSLRYHNFSAGTVENWTGTTGCGCDGRRMWWRGYYSGYYLEHQEFCEGCLVSGAQADCYDLPP